MEPNGGPRSVSKALTHNELGAPQRPLVFSDSTTALRASVAQPQCLTTFCGVLWLDFHEQHDRFTYSCRS